MWDRRGHHDRGVCPRRRRGGRLRGRIRLRHLAARRHAAKAPRRSKLASLGGAPGRRCARARGRLCGFLAGGWIGGQRRGRFAASIWPPLPALGFCHGAPNNGDPQLTRWRCSRREARVARTRDRAGSGLKDIGGRRFSLRYPKFLIKAHPKLREIRGGDMKDLLEPSRCHRPMARLAASFLAQWPHPSPIDAGDRDSGD